MDTTVSTNPLLSYSPNKFLPNGGSTVGILLLLKVKAFSCASKNITIVDLDVGVDVDMLMAYSSMFINDDFLCLLMMVSS